MTLTQAREELSRANQRRTQVMDAAMKCFGRSGFHGASMADIAAEAAMSVGQIYRYFENKEAIIAAIVARDLKDALARTEPVRDRDGDVVDALIEIVRFKIELEAQPLRAALVLEILAEAARNPRVADIVREADEAGRAWLRDLLLARGIRRECVEARMDMIALLIEGWTPRTVKDPNIDKEAYLTALRHTLDFLLSEDQGPEGA